MNWYKLGIDGVIKNLGTDIEKGLVDWEVQRRIKKYGENKLKREPKKGFMSKLIGQFSDFLILVLIVAALVSIFIGEIEILL